MKIAECLFGKYDSIIYKSNIGKTILTIDDVPYDLDGKEFEKILNVLKKHNNKATFFVISSQINEINKHLLIRALKEGHHLANHGEHNTMHALCGEEKFKNEIEHCECVLKSLYNEANVELPKTKYFRPGCGYVTDIINKYCKQNNYIIVLGSIYPADARIWWEWLNEYYITKHLSEKKDDIIILHDRYWTPEMLDKLFSNTELKTFSCTVIDDEV